MSKAVTAMGTTSVTQATSTAPKMAARRCAGSSSGSGAIHSTTNVRGAPMAPARTRVRLGAMDDEGDVTGPSLAHALAAPQSWAHPLTVTYCPRCDEDVRV